MSRTSFLNLVVVLLAFPEGVALPPAFRTWKPTGQGAAVDQTGDVSLLSSSMDQGTSTMVRSMMVQRQVEELKWMAQCVKESLGTAAQDTNEPEVNAAKYPFEPLLDMDYIMDADNYLEDYMRGYDIPQLAREYLTATNKVTTEFGRTPTQEGAATTMGATAGKALAELAAESLQATQAVTFTNCFTHAEPRIERRFQFLLRSRPAPPGTLCLFGVTARDERSHCVQSAGKFGSFGWCYTKEDKSEWGACGEGCPLYGGSEMLAQRIDELNQKVRSALGYLNESRCIPLSVTADGQ
mmetsp:Transcript_79403/g.184259  ORF Transcript_79403/g.184259 Transcript_79403/m.184259 type:complete len:296 (+) Transcript_79403:117-1004(+)|eukprot:CAMPEP_0171097060 /NCGR_PEP_ID=MMETSP0766_2-20121228/46831_1 /TAXON_ID=439317 /ORGANISM="Gambierdiscus australes, Strain CAWD 149" /LENGTH=295 /DNA_ID=CAMNT_0011556185 /DNA_START=83 /DNA_END=970 /DNA_ORIENTATION=-